MLICLFLATGSVREPARACGVWGIKLTQGTLPDEGLQPSCRYGYKIYIFNILDQSLLIKPRDIDSFGLFARSSKELYNFAKISLGDRVKGDKVRPAMLK